MCQVATVEMTHQVRSAEMHNVVCYQHKMVLPMRGRLFPYMLPSFPVNLSTISPGLCAHHFKYVVDRMERQIPPQSSRSPQPRLERTSDRKSSLACQLSLSVLARRSSAASSSLSYSSRSKPRAFPRASK